MRTDQTEPNQRHPVLHHQYEILTSTEPRNQTTKTLDIFTVVSPNTRHPQQLPSVFCWFEVLVYGAAILRLLKLDCRWSFIWTQNRYWLWCFGFTFWIHIGIEQWTVSLRLSVGVTT